jgi:hypothetical protein
VGIVTEGVNLDTILPKFTKIPQEATKRYYSMPGSEAVLLQVYQIYDQSNLRHAENKLLGDRRISGSLKYLSINNYVVCLVCTLKYYYAYS